MNIIKIFFIVLTLFLSSCAYVNSLDLNFDYALNSANIRREDIRNYAWPTLEEAISLSYYSNNMSLDYSYNLSTRLFNTVRYMPRVSSGSISISSAKRDVYKFFNELRLFYVRYTFLGGDEVFLPIRDKIIKEINYSANERIRIRELSNMLNFYLKNSINNFHFILGDDNPVRRYIRFSNENYHFGRNELGYLYNPSNGYIVREVYGYFKSDVFRLFLNAEGELFYSPFINYFRGNREIPFSEPYKLTIIYENGAYENIYLQRHIVRSTHSPRTFTDFIRGIPVVTSSNFNDFLHQLDFSRTAFDVKEEPIIILDLRSHGGGHPEVFYLWQYLVLGDFNLINSMSSSLGSYVRTHSRNLIMSTPNGNSPLSQSFIELVDVSININSHEIRGFRDWESDSKNLINEDQPLLIVLIDNRTASAGEISVLSTLGIDNILLVGNDTWGIFVTSTGDLLTLPNSGIEFTRITSMHLLPPELTRFEGRGIPPDVTITSNTDALAAVLNLLERSGMIKKY